MSVQILRELGAASAAGSLVLLLLCLTAPLADRYFSKTMQYRALFIPIALFLGLGRLISNCAEQKPLPIATAALPPVMTAAQSPLPQTPAAVFSPGFSLDSAASGFVFLWLAVAALLFAGRLASYLHLRRSLLKSGTFISQKGTVPAPVICSSLVSTPMAAGLLRPIIFLPDLNFSPVETEMILTHEAAHIKRWDLWVKMLGLLCICIHWFNPLAYLLVRRMDALCEASCDEYVAANMTTGERQLYGMTILHVLVYRNNSRCVLFAPMSKGTEEVKRRLHRIMEFKTMSKRKLFLSFVLLLCVAAMGVLCAWSLNPPKPEMQLQGTLSQEILPPAMDDGGSQAAFVPDTQDVVKEETYEEPIPYEQELHYSQEYYQGHEALLSSGTDGLKRVTARRTYRDGQLVNTEILSEEVLTHPVPEKLLVGSLPPESAIEDELLLHAFTWPVDGGYLSAGFNSYAGHTGLDIAAKAGTAVLASRGGTVVHVDDHSVWPYGKRVDIDHGDGWLTRYAQLSTVEVAEGDEVTQGQQLGGVGKTGNATGNHLHFEIRYEGGLLDPANYIGTKAPD